VLAFTGLGGVGGRFLSTQSLRRSANQLAALPGVATVTSYVGMKMLSAETT